jgi:hypothetical protein
MPTSAGLPAAPLVVQFPPKLLEPSSMAFFLAVKTMVLEDLGDGRTK